MSDFLVIIFFRRLRPACAVSDTDYIDLYQVHGWDWITPMEETLSALDQLVRQGKVRTNLSNLGNAPCPGARVDRGRKAFLP